MAGRVAEVLFSVIIPTFNRNEHLVQCLDHLKPNIQLSDEDLVEVIVSDDSENGVAKELIEKHYLWVRWVEGPKRGPAANRNNGATYASGEWLVFTDDDCLPSAHWLQSYRDALRDCYDVYEGKTIADRKQQRFDEHAPLNLRGGNLWSCNFVIRKNIFFELGGFDENFPFAAMEDIDMNLRIQRGHTIYFVQEAVVVHPWRIMRSFSSYGKWLVSHKYFLEKHGIKRDASYRWSRTKIFISDSFTDIRKLVAFKFRGLMYFFEKVVFNFLMIVK